MKTKLFLSTALFLSIALFANSTSVNNALKDEEKEIKLQGSLGGGTIKSSDIPIEVFLSQYAISITFLQDLKDITIAIVDESGEPVYFDVVSPVNGETVPISISGWDEGIYTITFSNKSGGGVYGVFEI